MKATVSGWGSGAGGTAGSSSRDGLRRPWRLTRGVPRLLTGAGCEERKWRGVAVPA